METIYLADGLITFTYSEDIIGHCEIIQLKLHEGIFLEAFEHVNLLDKETDKYKISYCLHRLE